MILSQAALRVLDAIEKIEIQSLGWGFADGSLSSDEAVDLAEEIASAGESGEDLLEELIEAKVLFEHRTAGSDIRLRSRVAEMVRLLAASRQLFPGKPWQSAPRLVADFRIDRRPRRFPLRDQKPDGEHTQDSKVAMGEVDDAHDTEHEREPTGDQRVVATEKRALDDLVKPDHDRISLKASCRRPK